MKAATRVTKETDETTEQHWIKILVKQARSWEDWLKTNLNLVYQIIKANLREHRTM